MAVDINKTKICDKSVDLLKKLPKYFLKIMCLFRHIKKSNQTLQNFLKCYMTHPTVQVQSNFQITNIPLTERQRLKDDHLSTSLKFFKDGTGDRTQ